MEELRLFPRHELAVIPREKLEGYALDPEHPTGRHKARVFAAALGIRRRDWEYLQHELLAGVRVTEVRETRPGPPGSGYTDYGVDVPVLGLNARTALVRTSWRVEDDESVPPRLLTAYVPKSAAAA